MKRAAAARYARLEERFRNISLMGDVAGIVHWDAATLMPPGAAASRREQLALLSVVTHEWLTEPVVDDWLRAAEDEADSLSPWRRANLREMRRAVRSACAVPTRLVAEMTRRRSACEWAWRKARKEGRFSAVVAPLQEVLTLTRRFAAMRGEAFGLAPYDALLDEYEAGVTTSMCDALFAPLEARLPALAAEARARQRRETPPLPLPGTFARGRQQALARDFLHRLGVSRRHSRLDVSAHPFCGGATGDVRITSRFEVGSFLSGWMAVLHEGGHALYELGLPAAWRYQPVGFARGMAFHESQALIIEMQACRGRAFMEFAAPLLRKAFGGRGAAWEAGNLHRLCTRVVMQPIRVAADEVTYPLHVFLRYRLEKALFDGALEAADLPCAWREESLKLPGFAPSSQAEGVLQDIHWFEGAFGYFPVYVLGALMAAQLFAACARTSAVEEALARGRFDVLTSWLRRHIHEAGCRYDGASLLRSACGGALGSEAFLQHVERRYGNGRVGAREGEDGSSSVGG